MVRDYLGLPVQWPMVDNRFDSMELLDMVRHLLAMDQQNYGLERYEKKDVKNDDHRMLHETVRNLRQKLRKTFVRIKFGMM